MVDIQSATAEIRRGKKERKKKQDINIMSASAIRRAAIITQFAQKYVLMEYLQLDHGALLPPLN